MPDTCFYSDCNQNGVIRVRPVGDDPEDLYKNNTPQWVCKKHARVTFMSAAELQNRFDAILDKMLPLVDAHIDTVFSELRASVNEALAQITTGKAEVDSRFRAVHTEFTQQDGRLWSWRTERAS